MLIELFEQYVRAGRVKYNDTVICMDYRGICAAGSMVVSLPTLYDMFVNDTKNIITIVDIRHSRRYRRC